METSMKLAGLGLMSLALFGIPNIVSWVDRRRLQDTNGAHEWHKQEKMPLDLKLGTVFMNETPIRMDSPIAINGRVDQVYLTRENKLVPVDTKSRGRHRVYDSDILQVSIYALILSQSYENVARHGYIRTVV